MASSEEGRKKSLLFAVTCFHTIPKVSGLVLSALLGLHEALLLMARGLDLCVGRVVGVVAELHGWPVVRSPLQRHRGKISECHLLTGPHP